MKTPILLSIAIALAAAQYSHGEQGLQQRSCYVSSLPQDHSKHSKRAVRQPGAPKPKSGDGIWAGAVQAAQRPAQAERNGPLRAPVAQAYQSPDGIWAGAVQAAARSKGAGAGSSSQGGSMKYPPSHQGSGSQYPPLYR